MAARLTRLWVALVLLALLTATTSTLLVHANRHSHHATNDIPLVTSPTCRHLTHLGAPLRALMSAFHLIDSPRSLFACATTTTTHSCHATVACHLGSGAVIATVLSFYAVALASLLELHQRLTTRPALLSLLFTLFVTLLTALPRLLLRSYLYSDLWFLFLLSFSLLTSLTLNLTALRYTSRTLPFPTYSNTNSTVPSRAQSPNSSRAPSPHSDYLSGSALSDPMTIESLSISQRQKSPTVTPTPPTATPTAAAATTTTTTTESRRQQQTEGESQLIRPARLGYRPETISHLRARESQLFRHPTSSSSSSSAHASSALPLNVLSQLQTSLSLKERSLTDSFRRALSPICLLSLLFALSLAINIFLASRSIAPKSEL